MARNRFRGGFWAFGLIVVFGSPAGRAADPPAGAKDGEPCWHGGDINDDGMVSAGDAQLAFLIALGSIQPTPDEFCWADCNGDGTVSAGDAQRIFYAAIGLDECPSNLANGQLCTAATQCRRDHCQNGHCCDAGDCCFAAADCPAAYSPPPACLDVALCQGERRDPVCTDFMCDTVASDDDSGCGPEIEADTCGYYVSVYCNGAVEQNIACPTACESDAACDPDGHCEGGACIADWPDGGACDADSDCLSDHCTNGTCCATGDCCTSAATCAGLGYFRDASCETPATCQGTREDAVCTAGFVCTTEVIADDSACGSDIEADPCGLYVSIYCTGEDDQTVTCPSSCENDAECDPEAHCEGGACIADWPDGGACDADGDCLSAHCANGTCCATGDCCTTAGLCTGLGYVREPSCDTPATCQGTREDAVCTAGFTCTTEVIADDSACGTAIEANPCGYYVSVYCTGEPEQTVTCPSTCTDDAECDPEAHCEGGACIADWPDGGACDAAGDCLSGYCGNGHCCAAGDCCAAAADCAGLGYDSAPVCETPTTCQGTREDAVCNAEFACASHTVDDDSACGDELEADTCGLYVSVYCTGATEQNVTCPGRCIDDTVCDDEAHCEGGACIADLENGGACDSGGDCVSDYCTNGHCCHIGDCCAADADCAGLGYDSAPVCENPATCQGRREDAQCSGDFECQSLVVDDDSGCGGDIEADPCGLYVSAYCTGEPEQTVTCPSTCADDAECDPEAHCEGGACIADWPAGGACDSADDCESNYCSNGHCCDIGDCCAADADCAGLGYDSEPVCEGPGVCQGTRGDAVCNAAFTCSGQTVDDDSACGAGLEASDCGLFPSIYCTGEVEQTAPECATTCAEDGDCDPGVGCIAGVCGYLASCRDILDRGVSAGDGFYTIQPPGKQPFSAYCDMTTDGGGWTRLAHVTGTALNLTSDTYQEGLGSPGDANYVHPCTLFENLDLTNAVMRMNMGAVRDYFKPHSGADVCQMVVESPGVHHLWAATYDGAFVQPSYYSGHLGGSATNWPQSIDGRAYLSFWGYNGSTASGCCHAHSANYDPPVDSANWGQPFDMYFREADYPSCSAILRAGASTGDGVYTIHPPGEPAFPVWCDMTTEGGGFVDLVATLHLPGIDLAEYRDRFFLTNNAYTLTLGLGHETTSQAPGFYLINNTPTFTHTEGFHFRSPVPYSQARLTYRMQGDDEGYRCSHVNWIPLNGPGYNGGFTGYQSPCVDGYSCIQGTTTASMDTPILVSYANNSINSANTLLTWSGSGVGSAQTGNCARDPEIPIANPSTFFTRFLIREPVHFASCQAVLAAGASQGSGIYTINPDGGTPIDVYCDMATAAGGWTLVAKFSNQDARHWVTAKSDWTSSTAYGAAADLTPDADAKSAAWGRLAGSEILLTDHVNPGQYIATNNNCLGGVSPAAFFTAALATFPTVQNSYYKVCTVSRTYFPGWAAEPGWSQPVGSPDLSLSTDHFVVAQVDTSFDTSGVLSFYKRDWFVEADVGLGAMETGAQFEDTPYQQDVGGPTSCSYNDAECRTEYPETVFFWIR